MSGLVSVSEAWIDHWEEHVPALAYDDANWIYQQTEVPSALARRTSPNHLVPLQDVLYGSRK